MEEDITLIEEEIKSTRRLFEEVGVHSFFDERLCKAIENIIIALHKANKEKHSQKNLRRLNERKYRKVLSTQKKKDLVINEMAEQLVGLSIYDEDKQLVIFKNAEEVKKYFAKKVEKEGC